MKSELQLRNLLQEANPQLNVSLLLLSPPVGTGGKDSSSNNTVVSLSAPANSKGFTGGKIYTYTRIDLPHLFKGINVTADCNACNTHELMINFLNQHYGLDLEADEFIESTPDTETGYKLHAKDNNYKYVNSIHIEHRVKLSSLPSVDINGFIKPTDALRADMYGLSLGEIESVFLSKVKINDNIPLDALVKLLNYHGSLTWVVEDVETSYNLYNARVINAIDENDGKLVFIELDDNYNTGTTNILKLRGTYKRNIPVSSLTNYSNELSDFLTLKQYERGQTLTDEEVRTINDVIGMNPELYEALSTNDEVVYHGSVKDLPEAYLHLVGTYGNNIIIFDTDNGYIVITY